MKFNPLPSRHAVAGSLSALMMALPGTFVLSTLPATASAQHRAVVAAEVQSLSIRTDGDLEPGTRMNFRAEGTPRAQATVRVQGVRERIPLREVSPGVYVGRYTIKRGEVVEEDREVRVMLRMGNRTTAVTYNLAESLEGRRVAPVPPPVAVAPPPPPPRIDRFGMAPVDRLEPGTELRFTLDGLPGANVVVDLPGVANDVGLREIRPGHYEGAYTLRRADNLNPNRPLTATLRIGDRVVTSSLAVALVQPPPQADARPPQVLNIGPRDGEAVPAGVVQVSANFEDRGGSGVDPATVRIVIGGRNVTPDAQVTANSFAWRANLPPGRYAVDVSARDRAGNAVRREWSFDVGAVAPIAIPLQILNHGNNGVVEGSSTMVQGRTAAFATVEVKVDGSARVPGGFSVSQQVHSQTLQADGNGNFTFSFTPRFPIPGSRYDISMVSSKGGASADARLVLFQR